MTSTLLLAMASFALVASISPGPVNSLALASGVRHGFRRSLGFVTGATVGFTALLLLAGIGMAEIVARLPVLNMAMRLAATAFLFYLAIRLWRAGDGMAAATMEGPPTLWLGASLQWLNPKAWIAALAGMGAFGLQGGMTTVLVFAALYFAICYLSIALWAYAGSQLSRALGEAGRMVIFNRIMAALLALGAVSMLAGY